MYRVYHSPVGALGLLVEAGYVTAVLFEDHTEPSTAHLGGGERGDSAALDQLESELDAYFAGELSEFTVACVDLPRPPFTAAILDVMRHIPYGTTVTYSELAEAAGNSKAVRSVGTMCATNLTPLVVPCHRVLPASGGYGQYLGGEHTKAWLIEHEQSHRQNS